MAIRTAPPIPKRIHQVWLGPRPAPLGWLRTWQEAHPAWKYVLWRESALEALRLRNGRLWGRLLEHGIYDAASDVARVEILHRFGGVYIDADSRCLRPLDGAPFLDAGFFATKEIRPGGAVFVTNAFMGAVAGHPLLERYIAEIGRARIACPHRGKGAKFCCAWKVTGPMLLSRLVRRSDAVLLEPSAFFTRTLAGDPVPGEGWGEHFWSSTGERSPEGFFPGAASYEEAMV